MSRLPFLRELEQRTSGNRRIFKRSQPYWIRCDLGHVLDISSDGVRLLSKRRRRGFVTVRLWDQQRGLRHRAEVKWCRKVRFRQYEVGLQFVNFGPEVAHQLAEIAAHLHE